MKEFLVDIQEHAQDNPAEITKAYFLVPVSELIQFRTETDKELILRIFKEKSVWDFVRTSSTNREWSENTGLSEEGEKFTAFRKACKGHNIVSL